MAEVKEKPSEVRKSDGVLMVVQNNAERTLTITGANEVVSNLLGYAEGDLVDHPLNEVLGGRVVQYIKEELEFTDEGADFGDIFARQPTVRLKHRLGEELQLDCSVMRVMAHDRNARFQLVLPNEREKRAQQQLRDFLKTNLESRQEVDAATGLPNRTTTENYLKLLKNYLAANEMTASFAVIRLDRHERNFAHYGEKGCQVLLQHVANCCRSTFRSEDVVSVLADHVLGLILFDISRESVRMVLNRLRWNVRNHRLAFGSKDDFSVTISIAFDMINEVDEDILSRCETEIERLGKDERNGLIELSG